MPAPYNLIVADPPWDYSEGAGSCGVKFGGRYGRAHPTTGKSTASNSYPVLKIPEIIALKPEIQKDAILLMWSTTHIEEALQVLIGWGFVYVSNMVWVKNRAGLGQYARQQHELILIGRRGHPGSPQFRGHYTPSSVINAPRGAHSTKPAEAFAVFEKMFSYLTDRLEMFARAPREGWDVFGNEIQ